jgi:hypothetical protein
MAQVLKTCGRKPSEVRILYPPPVGKRGCWLVASFEGSPAVFRRKIEFFVFFLQSKTPEAGFPFFLIKFIILFW